MAMKTFWQNKAHQKSSPIKILSPAKSEYKKWVRKLDTLFSIFIRHRDCGGPQGYGFCITCSKLISTFSCDAGHYIGRENHAVRWNETNVHAQCRKCNRFMEGNKGGFEKAIIERCGQEAFDKMILKKQLRHKYHVFELKAMYQDLQERMKG